MNEDFWKQFLASMVRHVLTLAGGWLLLHAGISTEQASELSASEVAQFIAGGIVIGFPQVWSIAKIKFNILYQNALHQAVPSEPMSLIKDRSLSGTGYFTSSV